MRSTALIVMLLAVTAVLGSCKQERFGLAPGEHAPAPTLKKLDGSQGSLKDFRGKAVLLNFWASWCAPCVAELPALQRASKALNGSVTIVGVGIDDIAENLAGFRDQYELTFPIFVDEKGEMKNSYKIQGVPESFLIKPDGSLVMIQDPEHPESPGVRIVGPRHWDSPEMLAVLKRASE